MMIASDQKRLYDSASFQDDHLLFCAIAITQLCMFQSEEGIKFA